MNENDSKNRSETKWQWIFVERLVKERKKKGWSQEKLAEAVGKETATVSSWEQFRAIPPFDVMVKLSQLFDCDLDYLTGRIDEETHSIKTACEVTGLSPNAIKKLRGKVPTNALTHLIESHGFIKFMTAYNAFLDLLGKMKHIDPQYGLWTTYRQRADGSVVMSNDDAVHHFMQKSAAELTQICEDAYERKVKKDRIRPNNLDYEDLIAQIEATEQEIKYLQNEKDYLLNEILPTFTGEAPPDDTAIFEEKE